MKTRITKQTTVKPMVMGKKNPVLPKGGGTNAKVKQAKPFDPITGLNAKEMNRLKSLKMSVAAARQKAKSQKGK